MWPKDRANRFQCGSGLHAEWQVAPQQLGLLVEQALHACGLWHAGAFEKATKRLMDELEWDSILPCHGNFISAGGKQMLRKHLGLNLASNKYR